MTNYKLKQVLENKKISKGCVPQAVINRAGKFCIIFIKNSKNYNCSKCSSSNLNTLQPINLKGSVALQCIPKSSFVSTKGCMNYHLSSSGKFKNKYICLNCNPNLILIMYSNGSKIYNGCVDKKYLKSMDSKCQ